ncbi:MULTISPECIES: ankyrin repeat domain-containing protein [Candidatus Cardinium]|uniref:ankyrin repeat domain-containing protein n=1 Tax=Candidatus Cardinium TaxID=273135 RepID=UPI001FA98FC9|nr:MULTISPECIES: ankyrin repeat domain-containing protein [Cardinium]
MKKHVDYKVALSVGLFSLSTLSSCVNTGQTYMDQTGDTGPISQVSSSKEKDCSSITTGSVQPSMVLSEEFLDKMHKALYKSKEEAIEVWRNARLHKDARDSHGFTLLMHLTQKGSELSSNDSGKTYPEYTRRFWDWFVERADLDEKNAKNNNGDTALMLAAKRFHTAFIRRLIEHGADPFIKNNKGEYFMTLLIKSTYRLYHISDFKSFIASVFEDVEKYINKHRTRCEQDINDFINSVGKAIEEKYKQDNAFNYEEQLNAFIKNIGKANKSSA